mmetsp:Transcript_58212/g.136257  ORF Transcript_58212/g.136257 Transcript_58212/m.136257 type:complete len:240 (-) Transcript_58212:539-1258(-)
MLSDSCCTSPWDSSVASRLPYIRARCLRTCNQCQWHKTRSRRCNGSRSRILRNPLGYVQTWTCTSPNHMTSPTQGGKDIHPWHLHRSPSTFRTSRFPHCRHTASHSSTTGRPCRRLDNCRRPSTGSRTPTPSRRAPRAQNCRGSAGPYSGTSDFLAMTNLDSRRYHTELTSTPVHRRRMRLGTNPASTCTSFPIRQCISAPRWGCRGSPRPVEHNSCCSRSSNLSLLMHRRHRCSTSSR